MKWRGMRCPKCRVEYPKGARFCSNCGYEPLERSNVRRTLILMTIAIVPCVGMVGLNVIAEDWIDAIGFGLILGIEVYVFGVHFRHVRLAKPADSETIVSSDGR